jgi:3',5'-cyclic AMP phosphodiesterase CpdA
MDLAGLKSADRLENIIKNHPQVKLLVSGHLHRPIQTSFGSTMVSVCPSTGNQLKLDLNPKNGSAVDEPPGFQLHIWKNDRFVTHTGTIWDGKKIDMSEYVAHVSEKISKNQGIIKD